MTLGFLRWSSLRDQLRTSLWPTPVGVTVTCAVAALGLAQLDHALSSDFVGWYVYGGRADGARELLSTIASSMLTIAGLVFSITILVLQAGKLSVLAAGAAHLPARLGDAVGDGHVPGQLRVRARLVTRGA